MAKQCKVCPDHLAKMAAMDAVEFRQLMDEIGASLDVMAGLLSIARRNVAAYRKNKPIPPTVALAVRQIRSLA